MDRTPSALSEPAARIRRVSRNLTQSKLPFQTVSAEEYAEQQKADFERLGERMARDRAKEELLQRQKADFKRSYEREKKRLQRFRRKWKTEGFQTSEEIIEIEDSDGVDSSGRTVLTVESTSGATPSGQGASSSLRRWPSMHTTDTSTIDAIKANVSGAGAPEGPPLPDPAATVPGVDVHQELARHSWSGPNTAHRRDLKYKKALASAVAVGVAPPPPILSRMNWQKYPYWLKITAAQEKLATWSPAEIVKYLRLSDPALFSGLHSATLAKWIVKDEHSGRKCWSKEALDRARAGRRLGMTVRSKTLVCARPWQIFVALHY